MAHVESAHLVELALHNASPTDADAEALRHIEHCARCRDELGMLTRLVTAARTAQLADLPTTPPARVWKRIDRGLSTETAPPGPHTGTPDHRKRALLALLALAAAAGIAHRYLPERSKLVHPRARRQDRPGSRE
ncbi:hypothetical protein ACPCBX_17160 [Streptomyces tuirus]|uniref:Zinc-finger domain-containing protein n=1 Tax=Streptomyces tuirus TaxID=68278 RepID=A0A7G1NM27_9ACTN|nr:hypothetical protein [Streptomyces tuirus]BCL22767.1 hypothetical protein GCM10017668_46100 [Streptomyces tuirus]